MDIEIQPDIHKSQNNDYGAKDEEYPKFFGKCCVKICRYCPFSYLIHCFEVR